MDDSSFEKLSNALTHVDKSVHELRLLFSPHNGHVDLDLRKRVMYFGKVYKSFFRNMNDEDFAYFKHELRDVVMSLRSISKRDLHPKYFPRSGIVGVRTMRENFDSYADYLDSIVSSN